MADTSLEATMHIGVRTRGLVAAVVSLPLFAATWPAEDDWQPLTQDNVPITDPVDAADPSLDLVDAGTGVGAWYADATHLHVRMQVDDVPGPTWALPGRRYAVLLDLDDDDFGYEVAAVLGEDGLSVAHNSATLRPSGWGDPADATHTVVSAAPRADGLVQVAETDAGTWTLDLALPVESLQTVGYSHGVLVRVALVTDDDGAGAFTVDLAGGGALGSSVLADGLSDPVVVDSDGDGLTLGEERDAGTDPTLNDTDGDGVSDGTELGCPLEGSDEDRDGDGFSDEVEAGVDTDEDGSDNFCDADDDGDGWSSLTEGDVDTDGDLIPDYLDDDSDGDGILDQDEPLDDTDCDDLRDRLDDDDQDGPCGDADGDGLDNQDEADCGTDSGDPDTDGDGVPDGNESCTDDSDGDGIVDVLDDLDDASSLGDPLDESTNHYGYSGGHFGGGGGAGCSAVPVAPTLLAIAMVCGAVIRRRRPGAAVAIAALAIAPVAHAQELNAQRHRPALGAADLWTVHDGRRDDGPGIAARVNTAANPLVYRVVDADGQVTDQALLAVVSTADLMGWARVGPVRIGALIPAHMQAAGNGVDSEEYGILGDIGFDLDVALLPVANPVAVSVGGRLTAPTGSESNWLGSTGATTQARVAASVGGDLRVAAETGFLYEPPSAVGDLAVGSRLTGGIGLRWRLQPGIRVSAELAGEHILEAAGQPGATPVELLGGLHMRPDRTLQASIGAGVGLTSGLGAPKSRLMTQLRVRPQGKRP